MLLGKTFANKLLTSRKGETFYAIYPVNEINEAFNVDYVLTATNTADSGYE